MDYTTHDVNLSLLSEPVAHELISFVSLFSSVVKRVGTTHEDKRIVTYLYKLTQHWACAFHVLWKSDKKTISEDAERARLVLFWATRVTLGNGLQLLGLKPLKVC
jgi:arginyl-tRNA synthetase